MRRRYYGQESLLRQSMGSALARRYRTLILEEISRSHEQAAFRHFSKGKHSMEMFMDVAVRLTVDCPSGMFLETTGG